MTEYLLMLGIIFTAGFIQGLTGFGSVLLSLPLLTLFIDIKTVIPLVSLFALCINFSVILTVRKNIFYSRLVILLCSAVPAFPLGTWALKHVQASSLTILLGCLIIIFTGYQLAFRPRPIEWRLWLTSLAGAVAGFLGGCIGANGPPIIIYATTQPWPKDRIKATLASYFFLADIGISLSHFAFGMITPEVTGLFFKLIPALALGIFMGIRSYNRIPDTLFRTGALVLTLLLGIMILTRSLRHLL